MSKDYQTMQAMKEFVASNLQDCCAELVEWSDSTVLVNGKVRLAATLLRDVGGTYSLSIVESEIKHQALVKVANES